MFEHSAHLPPSVGQHEETEGYRRARHGVRGWHAVLRVVEDLHLDHGGRRRSRPAHHVLGGLAQEQVPGPDDDEPAADQRVDVPEDEGEEDDEEHLVAEFGAEREQVEEELVVHQELLADIFRQRVPPQRLRSGRVGGTGTSTSTGGAVTVYPVDVRRCGGVTGVPVANTGALLRPLPESGAAGLRQVTVRLGRLRRKRPFNAAELLEPGDVYGVLEIVTRSDEAFDKVVRHGDVVVPG